MSTTVVTRQTPYADLPEWLSVAEVAEYLDLTQWAVYQNIHRGAIPHRRVGPKILQIPRSFLDPSNAQMAEGVPMVAYGGAKVKP